MEQRPSFLVHTYRQSNLFVDEEQRYEIEKLFGVTRTFRNILIAHLSRRDLKTREEVLEEVKRVLKEEMRRPTVEYMRDTHPVFLSSTAIALAADWFDYTEGRISQPVFRNFKDEQVIWVLDAKRCKIEQDHYALPGDKNHVFRLTPAKIDTPGKVVACRIERINGQYRFSSLYEQRRTHPHPKQDHITIRLGLYILEMEPKEGIDDGVKQDVREGVMASIRKSILDRYLRNIRNKAKLLN